MITLIIDNAKSQVLCDYMLRQELSDIMSYEVEGSFFARRAKPHWDGRKRFMNGAGEFPTGLISMVVKYFMDNKIEYKVSDRRRKPAKIDLPEPDFPYEPRYYQADAMRLTDERPRGVFLVGTGGGKGTMIGLTIWRRSVPSLIVTPDTGLRKQLGDSLTQWFGSKYVGFDVEQHDKPIVVANIQSLRKDPKHFKRFGLIAIDEFHHAAAQTYLDLNLNAGSAYYRYGFTGTFVRPSGNEMTMHGVLSRIIYTKSTTELIEEGFLVRPDITITKLDLKGYRSMRYKDAYEKIIVDPILIDHVVAIAKKKIEENKQTLILVRRKVQGEILASMIEGSVFLTGDDDEEKREYIKAKFLRRELRCMIATKIFGEGQDIPSIDVMINCRCEKTEIETIQGIGRVLRKMDGKHGAEVFDFLITGQKNLKEHSIERINSYQRESAFKIRIVRG